MFKRKGGGESKAFWTMLKKPALFLHGGFPYALVSSSSAWRWKVDTLQRIPSHHDSSQSYDASENRTRPDCRLGPRETHNRITSVIDGGSTPFPLLHLDFCWITISLFQYLGPRYCLQQRARQPWTDQVGPKPWNLSSAPENLKSLSNADFTKMVWWELSPFSLNKVFRFVKL